MKNFLNIVVISLLIYTGSWYFVYKTNLNTLAIQSEDTVPAMIMPLSIINHQTLYLDQYYYKMLLKYPQPDDKSYAKGNTPFYLKKIIVPGCVETFAQPANLNPTLVGKLAQEPYKSKCTHYMSAFPIISGLLAVPVYFVALTAQFPINWENLAILSHITSALIIALSGGFFYVLLKKYLDIPDGKAYLVTAVYLLGTINFALISQGLWQHGTLQLFVILGLLFLQRGFHSEFFKDKMGNLLVSSFFFGWAVLSRPTAALAFPFLFLLIIERLSEFPYSHYQNVRFTTIFIFIKHSIIPALVFLLGLVPAVLFFFWYNNTYFITIQNQGYFSQLGSSWLSQFPEGFLGVWFSPSKGILLYSPIFILSFVGLYFAMRRGGWRSNIQYLIYFSIVAFHTLVISRWKHWYGGWSFGYRMSSDIIPYLTLLLVPYVKSEENSKNDTLFKILFGLSIVVQIYGMIFFDGVWHAAYDKGFKDTAWLWSLQDSEVVFNMRRVLVKLNILDKACQQCLPKPERVQELIKPRSTFP